MDTCEWGNFTIFGAEKEIKKKSIKKINKKFFLGGNSCLFVKKEMNILGEIGWNFLVLFG